MFSISDLIHKKNEILNLIQKEKTIDEILEKQKKSTNFSFYFMASIISFTPLIIGAALYILSPLIFFTLLCIQVLLSSYDLAEDHSIIIFIKNILISLFTEQDSSCSFINDKFKKFDIINTKMKTTLINYYHSLTDDELNVREKLSTLDYDYLIVETVTDFVLSHDLDTVLTQKRDILLLIDQITSAFAQEGLVNKIENKLQYKNEYNSDVVNKLNTSFNEKFKTKKSLIVKTI